MPLSNFLFGSPAQQERITNLNPLQQQVLQNVNQTALQNLKGFNSNGFNFQPIEEQARRDFQNTTIPSIANRFASTDSLSGSGYRNALLGAGTNLESQLAALRAQTGLQSRGQDIGLLQSLLSLGLSPHQETIYNEGDNGFVGNLLSQLFNIGGFGLGGGFNAAQQGGRTIANLLSNFFQGGQ